VGWHFGAPTAPASAAGGCSAWRGSVGGPDRLGGGRFVDELQVADVAELPRIRFAWRRAVLEGRLEGRRA
jgi:hypothetical protein